MKKIPIAVAVLSLSIVMVVAVPLLGVTWWPSFDLLTSMDEHRKYVEIDKTPLGLVPDMEDCDPHSPNPAQTESTNGTTQIVNPNYTPLTYGKTVQVIDDTYMGQNVTQWQNSKLESLYSQYTDDFFTNLGALLIKNEMQRQMNNLCIVNADDSFEVVSGFSLTSLPPHIGFSSVVHATDGHYYLLEGSTFGNQVSYRQTTQLQYPDQSKYPTIDSVITKDPRILVMEDDNDLTAEPRLTVLAGPGEIELFNHSTETLFVSLGMNENRDILKEFSIRSNLSTVVPLDSPGVYSFEAESQKNIDGNQYYLNTGGVLVVLADDPNDIPMSIKAEISMLVLTQSNLPIRGLSANEEQNAISIVLDPAVNAFLPESRQYYLSAAQSLVPHEIEVLLFDESD